MPLEGIKEILHKYEKEENKIETAISVRFSNPITANNDSLSNKQDYLQLQDAINRNKEILKDLELIKGTLRSKAIFTPTEVQWENICKNYKEAPALAVATWKCHLPVFV